MWIRSAVIAIVVAAVAACGRGGASTGDKHEAQPATGSDAAPAREDPLGPRAAAERTCAEAIAAVAAALTSDRVAVPDPDAVRRVACVDLYTGDCRRAWADLAATGRDPAAAAADPDTGVGSLIERCAAVYCAELPAPKPAACGPGAAPHDADTLVELDRAILVHAGTADAVAAELARRGRLFAGIAITVPRARPPASTPQDRTVLIVITKTTTAVDSLTVTAGELAARVAAAVKAAPDTKFILQADQDVPYTRVVEAIDAIKAAGGTRFALSATK